MHRYGWDKKILMVTLSICLAAGGFYGVAGAADEEKSAASEETPAAEKDKLYALEVEIVDIETVKGSEGDAVLTVQDMQSGDSLKLFADQYQTLIRVGGEKQLAADIIRGSKATIIYRKVPEHEIPLAIVIKVRVSY
ncbi:MAG: hypothetical protein A3G33_08795 [Omnitrophica bacterium RIFCSPLOWO2_12_FULL_44_17]|uniref:DUF5666 domain-containing protein n=1 Tax=Candidatus Danuiimicrobium aquiferis TaxID=1801832 RepID=A0A1G1L1B0_9BACT|nr:MAG: hypothetical protein A3B72_08135 [Omnitrophica bacterium RIFCSPHIGHO2_02_FULL_45_28]OGW88510.1 MAG: hypothetical protein A3E74_06605 [Omnitrophica bacterium RIFCSPHIGHO2_12_FULL_44_12]OGW98926.1 MAG: hypothetical protein A3G33_08795 [Omnitrophica bacterium RIFCSPLOWO2_12_FULL_44_17]OGX01774.1 MAG: hypothetical protein A3J12_04920 [Omnitrophica bacterium RIFCSPLOWO2_02_FULL_44_11]